MKNTLLIFVSLILLGCSNSQNDTNQLVIENLRTNMLNKINFIQSRDVWARSNSYKDLSFIKELINDSISVISDSTFIQLHSLKTGEYLDFEFVQEVILDKNKANRINLYTFLNTLIDKIHQNYLNEHYLVEDITPFIVSKPSIHKDSIDVQVIRTVRTSFLPVVKYTIGNFSESELNEMISKKDYSQLNKIRFGDIDIQGSSVSQITLAKKDLMDNNLHGVFIYPTKDMQDDKFQIFKLNN